MASRFTQNKLGIQDQCRVTFKTKKGNDMLFLFMEIPHNPKRLGHDSGDHLYEIMNMESGERFVINGSKYDNHVRNGYFHTICRTGAYAHLTNKLLEGTSLKFIYHTDEIK
jgi:hypothetical protein